MSEIGLVILYHPDDAYFAARIGMDLKQRGVEVWVDYADAQPDINLASVMKQAVGYIPLLSPDFNAMQFENVKLDGANVFPLVVRAVESWPKSVRRELAIDFHEWEIPERYDMHLNETVRVLQNHIPGMVGEVASGREKYLYTLMGRLHRTAGVYVPLSVHAEPIEDDDAIDGASGEIVLRANDNLGERIARNREMTEAMQASDEAGLMQLTEAGAMLRFAPAFMLTGLHGSGKTTTLHALVLDSAKRALADENAPLPILLDAAHWKDGDKLLRTVQASTNYNLKPVFEGNEYELYIDNLDLTGGRNWQFLDRWLEREDTPQIVIIAIDAARYDDELGLPIVSLDPLKPETMEIWQKQLMPDAELFEFPNLARLPFFFDIALRILRKGESIPTTTGRLLDLEIRARLADEKDAEDLITKLGILAVAVIDDEEPTDFDYSWASGKLSGKSGGFLRRRAGDENSERLLQAAIRYHLIERNNDTIRFQHTFLHSYFAAIQLKKQGIGGSLRRPEFDAGRRLPGKWDNALLMACQLLDNADVMVRDVILTDPILAAMCIVNGAIVSDDVVNQVRGALVEQLTQNDWRVAPPAIQALRFIGETELLELMIDQVAYGDVYQRRMAARVLGEIGHRAGIPLLAEALHDETVRNAAQEALKQIGEPATVDVAKLLDASVSERWETRAAAAQILRSIGSTAAAHELVKALYDDVREVRWSVANALSELSTDITSDLLDVIHDDRALVDDDIMVAAASVMVWTDNAEGLQQLVEILDDVNPVRRARIAEVLGGSTNPIIIQPLIARLKDTTLVEIDEEMLPIAEIVAESLEEIGTPEALAAVDQWRQGNL